MNLDKERRSQPRIKRGISLKIAQDSFEFVTKTENISASGIYCYLEKPLPLMSKVGLALLLPVTNKDKLQTKKIRCHGVVVRSEPTILPDTDKAQQNIAIFFTDVKPADRIKIENYVTYQLLKKEENN